MTSGAWQIILAGNDHAPPDEKACAANPNVSIANDDDEEELTPPGAVGRRE